MARITDKWIRSTGLSGDKKESLYLLQVAVSVNEEEEKELCLDILDYVRTYVHDSGIHNEKEVRRIHKACTDALRGLPEYRLGKEELEKFITAYRTIC